MNLTEDQVLALVGEFTWLWNHHFFIETPEGNFLWSDPNYSGGDNSIRPVNMSFRKYLIEVAQVGYGRGKGKHFIGEYAKGAHFVNQPIEDKKK